MKVLVFLEQRDGRLKSSAVEALTIAAKLSDNKPENVAGVVVGQNISSLNEGVKNYGADRIFCADDAKLEKYNILAYADAVLAAVNEFQPDVLLGIASPMGRDLFPRLAAKLDAGLLTDLVEINFKDGKFIGGTKPMYAGKVLSDVEFVGEGLKLATLRPNVFPAAASSGDAQVQSLNAEIKNDERMETVEIRKGKSDKADLTEAIRIISGGRAMGNADNFKILHQCADVFGATVGASRAAVDSGYASHDMQVGQTGKTVNPTLYIACGISGAIQHMAGMRTSKIIVAVNSDPDAPIFSIADYGIVADLFEAVPVFEQEAKSMLN